MEVRVNKIEKRSWVEVDLTQLTNNFLLYQKSLKKNVRIMAVIKADAYGHGDVQVARLLTDLGVSMFAVSNIDEAVGLRDAGIKGEILILGYTSPYYAKTLYDLNLTQALVSEEYAELMVQTGYRVKSQFAIDTGMNRIGIDGDNAEECERTIRLFRKKLNINGIFTHLCVADSKTENDKIFTIEQIIKFKNIAHRLQDVNLPFIHCCNSAAGLRYLDNSELFDEIGTIVRLGIILYGLKPSQEFQLPEGIKPALTWKSKISMVKKVHRGETIGYGRTFKVERESVIATVTLGYADGFNRQLSNKGFVLINGHKAPVVGRVCMDQTLIDVTDIPNVEMGMDAIIVGSDELAVYSADEMADSLGTIGYEILCNISKRVQRFYVRSNNFM